MANTLNSLFFLRRACTVATENVKVVQPTASRIRKAAAAAADSGEKAGKEVFWMRHPKTGDWVPETHFEEVDAAELRKKLLCKKSLS